MIRSNALTLAALAVLALANGSAHALSLGFSLNAAPAAGASPNDLSVLVVDEISGQPLSGAAVIVADSLDTSASGSRELTGTQGSLVAKDALARGPRALTVSKDGYSTISILGLQSPQATVYLHPLSQGADTVIASGEMASWPDLGGDDQVVAGLAFQSLSALDLLHFTTASLISPLKDTIDVFGSHDVPSNFLIPDQDIPVFLASIHVSKPTYRLPVTRSSAVRVASVQGTIATSDIMSLAQGGKMSLGLLNKLHFTHAGVTGPLQADQDFSASLDASSELSPRHQVTPSEAPFAADILVAAATDLDGSRSVLLPTDIKLAASQDSPSNIQPVELGAPDTGAVHDVVTIAMADKGHRVSGIVSDHAGSQVAPGAFLDTDSLPNATALPGTVAIDPLPTGLRTVVFESQNATLWSVYALPGTGSVMQVPTSAIPAGVISYSVMSLDFGSTFDSRTLDGQSAMMGLQRFARSSATIGTPQN